jgi:hypothetical protein
VNIWENSRSKKNVNMGKVQDPVLDVVLTGQSLGVTIYIYAGTVLGKQRLSLGSKNMNR